MSQPQQPRRARGRRDLGCPRPWLLPPWLVTLFGIAFVAVLAVLFCQAVSS